MTRAVYFEDLYVGMRFVSEPEVVTLEAIIDFARINDPQYFHVDPEAARTSMFGELIGSGWQTSSGALRHLLSRSGMSFVNGCIGVDTKISWKRPVRPGDRLHLEGEITVLRSSRSRPDWGIVGFKSHMLDDSNEIVQSLDAHMLAYRDPARRIDSE